MPGFYENAGDPGNQFGLAAEASATEAKHWANYTPGVVVPEDGTEYSAKHYADDADTSATDAAASKTAAASSATDANTSAVNASTSATNAATSATNAGTSETNAAGSATAAGTSETNAAGSASAASTSATNASNSATAAGTSETNAANSATAAATSATNAGTSETNAANSATAAAASYDAFDDRYLGSKTADPTLDNDGDALLTGALYYNSSSNNMRFYNGVSWDVLQNYTHPNHTGDVTSSGDGATTISNDAVTNAKLANVATSTMKGRVTGGTGDPEDLTVGQIHALIGGAGLDADTLDGVQGANYLRTDNTGSKSVDGNPYLAQDTLTDGATITWTPTNGTEAFVTLGGNRTLVLNAVPPAGTWLTLMVRQDGTGNRTLAYSATYFNMGDSGAPVLSTGANRYDVLSFRSNGVRAHFIGIASGFTV